MNKSMAGNKELIVTEIVTLITGFILRAECSIIITNKYNVSEKTFDNYWKLANERVKQAQHATQITIIGKHTKEQIERAEMAIFSRTECLEQLTRIARSPDNLKNRPTVVISAISKICDIEGYDAPKVIIEEAKASVIDIINEEESIEALERLISNKL
jgi:hypothetical protein